MWLMNTVSIEDAKQFDYYKRAMIQYAKLNSPNNIITSILVNVESKRQLGDVHRYRAC